MSIPASNIVSVTPGVLGAGGNPLSLNGVILSESLVLPVGAPVPFPSYDAVSKYFGVNSLEAQMAQVYFNGFDISTTKPSSLLFSRYSDAAIPAFMRGGSLPPIATLQAITTGSLSIPFDGSTASFTTINLATASSYSDAAAAIQAALNGIGLGSVEYDSVFNAFTVTSGLDTSSSEVGFATGDLAATFRLTSATGALLSPYAAVMTPASAMATIVDSTQNWVGFTTAFEPDESGKEAFATWVNGTGGRYYYAPYDTDVTAAGSPGSYTGFGKWLADNSINGVIPVYMDPLDSAFVLGCFASVDFTVTNGRITLAFKKQPGLTATAANETEATNLEANGFNFYGRYATANDGFTYLYPGQISGDYNFADAYVDAIWLDNALQLALMELLVQVNSIPYNQTGYSMIAAAANDPIQAALNSGVIRTGVTLSSAQAAEVNAAAGVQIDQTLQTQGYYFQVLPASAQTRAQRKSPPCTLWYTDGGSVQRINLASIDIQ